MNNYDEVQQNYKKWHNIENKENYEKIKKSFLQNHLQQGITRVQIEPTNRCNFNCIMCPIDEIEPTKRKDLTFDEFRLILSKLPKSVKNICLSGLGEPFLNKNYIEMVKFAKEQGFYVEVYNNSSLFNKDILKYADEVNFSVDAIDQKTLTEIRKGVKPDKLFDTIIEAINNKLKCKININFTVNYKNYKDIKNIYQFCQISGVDHLSIQATSNNYFPKTEKYIEFKKFIEKNKLIDWEFIVKNYDKKYNFSLTIWYPRKLKGFCAWGFSNIYITSNLDIIQCCHQVTNPIIFGNLKKEEFNNIYNSEKMKSFRSKHIYDEDIFLCNNCPY
ncbi:radical SAM protein [Hydrogenimonas thermophila]|uniref:Radical SAM additional 4Fe4S-binding SPASM domain-containing protein n=1 Tax=Hydrogenimonas thermophila TaxID=223786 RepID=A0A1I5L373_9BACT|nr:radical SAM protein [Hydrogenimonas thermophila]WOE70033.1 radical SAM protein [Hydrogenimonas thermophila]WOE72550.1 radical SAM protein [Hydrogenimonas thermophila]SFO91764.1 radical SAM additional 4Fe4S-binding SPASM domain-containing protein [Hydrogenimonas thermophila]